MQVSLSRSRTRGGITLAVLLTIAVWGVVVTVLSLNGAFARLPGPSVAMLAALGVTVPTAAYAVSPGLRTWIEAVGLRRLTAFHVWRIPAALAFWSYGAQHMLPDIFVRNAATGDFIAGVLALLVVALWPRRPGYWLFHIFGFADFVIAVGTGFYFALQSDPLMTNIAAFPLALIPLFGVGISGATHLMAFHLLFRGRG